MDLIIFSLISAIGFVLVLTRALGLKRLLKWRKALDIILTFGMPIVMVGTFSGMLTSFFTGLWFTLITWLLNTIVNQDIRQLSFYGSQENDKKTVGSYCSSRS
jgi:multisubunit Na+/H+ antiporter MnhG subunit